MFVEGSVMGMKKYEVKFFPGNGDIDQDLTNLINARAEDGYVLHSIIPSLDEGTTKGYTVILELTVIEH